MSTTVDQEELYQSIKKRLAEMDLKIAALQAGLDALDEREQSDRSLSRLQHKYFKQQLYTIVTKDEIRAWAEAAAKRVGEERAIEYISSQRMLDWIKSYSKGLLDNAIRNRVIQTVCEQIAARYMVVEKGDEVK